MVFRSRLLFSFAAALAVATGCTSNGGFIGTDFHPRGNITISDTSGKLLTTSASAPYSATGGFSIVLNEIDFSGPYAVSVIKWNNGQKIPCFVPHMLNSTTFSFTADNANAPSAPATQPNACIAGDVEEAQISDNDGHSALFYFELPTTLVSTGVPSPSPAPSGSASAAPQSCTTDPAQTSATVTGAEQTFDFACAGDLVASVTVPANTGVGQTLTLDSSVKEALGAPIDSALGTGIAAVGLSPSGPITINSSTSGVAFSVASPKLILASHIYAIQIYSTETGSVVNTFSNLSPSGGKLTVSVVVPGATIAAGSTFIAVIYFTS